MDIGMLEEMKEKYDGYMLMKFTSSYHCSVKMRTT